jgi:hypothetical protein
MVGLVVERSDAFVVQIADVILMELQESVELGLPVCSTLDLHGALAFS